MCQKIVQNFGENAGIGEGEFGDFGCKIWTSVVVQWNSFGDSNIKPVFLNETSWSWFWEYFFKVLI